MNQRTSSKIPPASKRCCYLKYPCRFYRINRYPALPLLLLFIFIIYYYPLCAQQIVTKPSAFSVRSLTVDDGLPQGWVTQLAQDRQGFIWIVSDGLSRYDGHTVKTWRHAEGDSTTLASNNIVGLHADDHNRLWLIYTNKVDVMNARSGSIRHISSEPAFKWLTNPLNGVLFIKQNAGTYLYGGPGILGIFNPESGWHHEIKLPVHEHFIATGNDGKQQLWVNTEKALYKISNYNLIKIVDFPVLSVLNGRAWDAVINQDIYYPNELLADPAGDIICPALGGLFIYHADSKRADYFGDKKLDDIGRGLTRASNGIIYLFVHGHLYQLDENLKLSILSHQSNSLWLNPPMLQDKAGFLWTATGNSTGIRIMDVKHSKFQSNTYTSGFSHDVLLPWLNNPEKDFDFSSYEIRSGKDREQNIWVTCPDITSNHGRERNFLSNIAALKKTGARLLKFKNSQIHDLTFGEDGRCWVMAKDGNIDHRYLARADLKNGILTKFVDLPRTVNYNISQNHYLAVISNKIAVLVEDELRLYDTVTKACIVYSRKALGADKNLLMLMADKTSGNRLWIATQGNGILKLDLKDGRIVHYNTANGLPDNTVYFMAPDKHGYFWCSSNKGISRFNPADGTSVSFTAKDGLQGDEFNRYHFLETPDGHFIFGGTNGYTIFHPDSIQVDSYQTPVVIPEILVNNNPIDKTITGNNDDVSSLKKITLNYDQNFLSIGFAGLEYAAPERLRYRYQLEGFDKGWVKASGYNANYTFIPRGNYTFKVNATNSSGIWSNDVKILHITVLPPWWKTWWAYSFYFVIAGGVVFAVYRNGVQKAIAKEQIVLKEKEAEQLKAVDEMKSRFFSNITHEFRTPLSLILAPVGQMLNEEPSTAWKKQAGTIERNARQMLQLINQLMDMAKLEANSMTVSLFRGNLNDFIADQADAFKAAASAKNIKLGVNGRVSNDDYLFDADKLHTILSNLLANAVKFTGTGSSIEIGLMLLSGGDCDDFTVTVHDDGTGIAAEKLPFIFNRFYQADDDFSRKYEGTGIGLALAKELTELLHGSLEAASEIGKGSTFTLKLSLKKAADETATPYKPGIITKLAVAPMAVSPATAPETAALILVSEDNDELREFIAQIFLPHYRVLTAANGATALKIANAELPDVIVSDLMMPELNGYDFCKAIKASEQTDHIAFLLLTAKTSKLSLIEGLQNQADDYLIKPFLVDELLLRVNNLLSRQEILKQHFQRDLIAPAPTTVEINPFLQKLYMVIEQHISDSNFSVDQLADFANMSTRTLSRKLNALLGLTAGELIKKYRLKKAAELLNSGLGVAETAYEVGYDSPAHFSTIFKSAYGEAPSEYKS